jgi:hypothetical protein
MSDPFLNRRGIRGGVPASALLACALLLSGCLYSFTGGGLPGHIRTVAIVPFESENAPAVVSAEATLQLRTQIPSKLGLRLADQRVADAIIRGRILGEEETTPAFTAESGGRGGVTVLQRQVRINFEAEIYDVRNDRPIWKQSGLSAVGNFQPNREQASAGRNRAIEEMVQKIVEGAQSQW